MGGELPFFRTLADCCAIYGSGILGGRPDYRTFCGLWGNLSRVRQAQAVAVARGMGLATSTADVPYSYCAAVSEDEAAAWELWYQTNAERQKARIVSRIGR